MLSNFVVEQRMSNNVWSIIIRDSRVSTHRFRLKTNSSSGSKTAKATKTMCLKNNILLNIEKKNNNNNVIRDCDKDDDDGVA